MSPAGPPKVPFLDLVGQHRPLADELTAAFRDAVENADFVGGQAVESFEGAFAAYCGVKHVIGVANGTDGLRLAYLAAGIGPGDEVITAPNTFIATTEAISQTGARVVFADIDPGTRLLDPEAAAAAITPRTKAIVPVHLYGQAAPMDEFRRLADRHHLLLVEDAAQAQGARWNGSRCGSLGDVAAFSFYPGKNLGSCGEGGAVTTNDDEIARKVRILREHGQVRKYFHEFEGFNARLHAIQARFLEIKLRYLDGWNSARRGHAEVYEAAMREIPGLRIPVTRPEAEAIWHLYVIEIPNRDELRRNLHDHGVASGLHYPFPLHLLPPYVSLGYRNGSFPNAERSCAELLSLPMFPELTAAQIARVVECVRSWATAEVPTAKRAAVRRRGVAPRAPSRSTRVGPSDV
jgi:dTDP-4-amino-4,6-dideoxygalactose transaminase